MSPDASSPTDVPGTGVPAAAPETGDPAVDAVLGRMRAQLAEVSAEDPGARRDVLDRAHRELRVLLDEPASAPGAPPQTPSPGGGVGSVPG